MFRKARMEDLDRIEEIYNELHSAEERGRTTLGWMRGVYPTRQSALEAIEAGDLFVQEDRGLVVSCAQINRKQPAAYYQAQWQQQVPDDQIMVLHTLAVSPKVTWNGYGTRFIAFYEQYAQEQGCHCLRMDTNIRNLAARALYKKLGYREVSVVLCVHNGMPDIDMVCLEKKI